MAEGDKQAKFVRPSPFCLPPERAPESLPQTGLRSPSPTPGSESLVQGRAGSASRSSRAMTERRSSSAIFTFLCPGRVHTCSSSTSASDISSPQHHFEVPLSYVLDTDVVVAALRSDGGCARLLNWKGSSKPAHQRGSGRNCLCLAHRGVFLGKGSSADRAETLRILRDPGKASSDGRRASTRMAPGPECAG